MLTGPPPAELEVSDVYLAEEEAWQPATRLYQFRDVMGAAEAATSSSQIGWTWLGMTEPEADKRDPSLSPRSGTVLSSAWEEQQRTGPDWPDRGLLLSLSVAHDPSVRRRRAPHVCEWIDREIDSHVHGDDDDAAAARLVSSRRGFRIVDTPRAPNSAVEDSSLLASVLVVVRSSTMVLFLPYWSGLELVALVRSQARRPCARGGGNS